jgi:cellulose synthase/poly-beta-1,6-N-acetylglucosamine synthase-like glycosyltransferase
VGRLAATDDGVHAVPLSGNRTPVRLSVIVPATDDPVTIDRCRRAIAAAKEAPADVLVVDAAPGEGAAHARNAGALEATGNVLVFVDADVAVHPDAFVRIGRAFEEAPALTALFGSYDDTPSANGVVSVFRNLLHHHIHQTDHTPAQTFWAGLGAIRRDAFEALGGFDTVTPHRRAVEDIELGMRLVDAGGRIELDPELRCTHMKPWTLASMLRADLVNRGVPWVGLLVAKRRVPASLNLRWRHRLSAASWVVAVVALIRRRRLTLVAALSLSGWLNRSFYRLLRDRHGDRLAVIGFLLHGLHHLTAVVSVPVGVVVYLRDRRNGNR